MALRAFVLVSQLLPREAWASRRRRPISRERSASKASVTPGACTHRVWIVHHSDRLNFPFSPGEVLGASSFNFVVLRLCMESSRKAVDRCPARTSPWIAPVSAQFEPTKVGFFGLKICSRRLV